MTWHSLDVLADACPDDVVALLVHRPSAWLRPFLLLAAHADSFGAAGAPWYRIGDAVETAGGARSVGLRWRPHAGDAVFSAFTGCLVVGTSGQQVSLGLAGEARGGSDGINDAVLGRLMHLLAGAVAESGAGVR